MILELHEGNNIAFKLESLVKIEKIKIKKPTRGKKITLEEFNALSKKMFENRKN